MSFLSAALCSSTAFLSHQSDFSARVRFCSSLQASLYAAVVDLVLLVCNTLWWAWSLLLIRVCSSWSLGSNQSWCLLSGLPRYALAVLYTTCYRAAHSSSGVEFSFSSQCARALTISCSKLSLWLMVLSFAVLSLVGLLVPCLLCLCRILKATFDLSIWWSVQQLAPRMARVLWMSTLSRHLVMMNVCHICQCLHPGASRWSCVHPSAWTWCSSLSVRTQSTEPVEARHWSCISQFHVCPWPRATCHILSLSSHWSLLLVVAYLYKGCHWAHLPAGCRMPVCFHLDLSLLERTRW